MPYINTTTTKVLTDEDVKSLTSDFGKAIETLPGKTEEWLMLNFEGGAKMAFRGKTEGDFCYIEVSIYGNADRESCGALTAALTEKVGERLGIAPECVYVRIEETELWGYGGELL